MNNILIILPFLPYPLYTGGHQAVFNEINILRNKYNITICFQTSNVNHKAIDKLQELWPNVRILPFVITKSRKMSFYQFYNKISDKIKNIFFKKNCEYIVDQELMPLYKTNNEQYNNFIRNIIKKDSINIVQCEFVNQLGLVEIIPNDINIKKVFIHHELRFARIQKFMEERKLNSYYFKLLYLNLKSEEISLLNKYDSIVTFSQTDTEKLLINGVTTNIYTSFCLVNSYNLPYKFVPCSNVLTFVGPEVHSPNLIGLEYFLKNCWSQLVYKIPSISLKVIGKWNPDTIKKISNTYPQVKFLGFVDNLYEALQGSIMVVPITIGSGIRTKILEAGFMGIPIVTTTIGVEGIPLVDYKDCIIEDNPSKMVEKIYDLINNIQQQQMLSWNAYNKIKTTYSDDALLKTREQALN